MSETMGASVSGAILPRCVVGGRLDAAPRWRVGGLSVTREALHWRTRTDAGQIPLAGVVSVTGTHFSISPPPMPFDQCLLLHHLEANNVPVVTAVGYPGVTVGNFPLQLCAALVGTVPMRILTPGVAAEDAYFSFERDTIFLRRARGTTTIPLREVVGVSMRRARAADGAESLEWTLSFLEDDEVERISLAATDRLTFLLPFVSAVQALRRNSPAIGTSVDDIPEAMQQVAMLLYSGNARASSIEQVLALAPDEVDKLYEDLLRLGLASVVKVRKEVKLTSAGAALVAAIIKRQMEIPGSVLS